MAKLDRLLKLVSALNDTGDGLTLDELAEMLEVNRRTVERLRAVIAEHFDVEEWVEDRKKRFRIRDSLRRVYTRPTAIELAALQIAADAAKREHAAQAPVLESLLAKMRGALDDREKRRLDPDLDPLVRLQRSYVPAGPAFVAGPRAVAEVQGAMMGAQCLEFEYTADDGDQPQWRRVIPYGLIHGPTTYLIGQIPGRAAQSVLYRLDRMREVRASNRPGSPPDDWDIDVWMASSFGIWREGGHDIVLRVRASGVTNARGWRFHSDQTMEDDGGELIVRFHSGGLREIADHLFSWGGEVTIEAPEELRKVMRERLAAAQGILRPDLPDESA